MQAAEARVAANRELERRGAADERDGEAEEAHAAAAIQVQLVMLAERLEAAKGARGERGGASASATSGCVRRRHGLQRGARDGGCCSTRRCMRPMRWPTRRRGAPR